MSKEKFVVWSNLDLDLDDWRAYLEDEYPGLIDDELIEKMTEINDSYIDDERANLDIVTGTEIIAIADIGRWDGRYMGYSEIKSGKISDCLYSPHDYSEWYVDSEKEFRCTDVHHDGRNHKLNAESKYEIQLLIDQINSGICASDKLRNKLQTFAERLRQCPKSTKKYGYLPKGVKDMLTST